MALHLCCLISEPNSSLMRDMRKCLYSASPPREQCRPDLHPVQGAPEASTSIALCLLSPPKDSPGPSAQPPSHCPVQPQPCLKQLPNLLSSTQAYTIFARTQFTETTRVRERRQTTTTRKRNS